MKHEDPPAIQVAEPAIDPPGHAPPVRHRSTRRIGLRAPMPTTRAALTLADVRLTCLLPLYALAAWCLPEKIWPRASRYALAIERWFSRSDTLRARIAAAGVERIWGVDSGAIVGELEAGRIEHYFQYLRAFRPGGWRPRMVLEGRENLDAALARGHGVVLWVGHFVFSGLVAKMTLHRAGYRVWHLSRPEHGFSKTAYGIRVLNPLRTRVERRDLAGRLVIRRGDEQQAVRAAHRVLRSGSIVSITAGAWEGRRVAEVALLDGALPLATGAASLAHATGAALVPLFVVRTGRTFRVVADRPIDLERRADRDAAVAAAIAAYGRRLTPVVRAYPGQWRGWTYLRPRVPAPLAGASLRPPVPAAEVHRLIAACKDDVPAAAEQLARMLDERPASIEVAIELASLYRTLGEFDAAVATIHRAAALDSTHPDVLSLIVWEKSASRDFDGVRAALGEVEISGVWRRSHVRAVARDLARAGEYARAAQLWRRLAEGEPRFVDALWLATCELRLGNIEEAAKWSEHAIRRTPRGDQRYSALVECIAREAEASSLGRVADAFAERVRALQDQAPDAETRRMLDEARGTLEAVRRDPNVRQLRARQPLRASLICPIHRPCDLDNAVAQISRQTWPNVEVIFAVNSPDITEEAIGSRWRSTQPLTVLDCARLPTIGAVLNHAIGHCSGDVVLKIDADCLYGPRYCEDMLCALVHFGADVVSKKAKFRFFERSQALVLEHPSLCFAPAALGSESGGSALCFHRGLAAAIPFQTTAPTHEDTAFLRKAVASGYRHVFVDPFNHCSTRSFDQSRHSWVLDDLALCNGRPHVLIGGREAIATFVEV